LHSPGAGAASESGALSVGSVAGAGVSGAVGSVGSIAVVSYGERVLSELHARREPASALSEIAVRVTREGVLKGLEYFIGRGQYHPRSRADARDLDGTFVERVRTPPSVTMHGCACVSMLCSERGRESWRCSGRTRVSRDCPFLDSVARNAKKAKELRDTERRSASAT